MSDLIRFYFQLSMEHGENGQTIRVVVSAAETADFNTEGEPATTLLPLLKDLTALENHRKLKHVSVHHAVSGT